MKELDIVEVIINKTNYNDKGIFKGMRGVIMSEKKIDGKWEVVFSDNKTGEDTAVIMISEEDLMVVYRG